MYPWCYLIGVKEYIRDEFGSTDLRGELFILNKYLHFTLNSNNTLKHGNPRDRAFEWIAFPSCSSLLPF